MKDSSQPSIYIALDLETTGFDANQDQVIEIAAIKFQGQEIIEEFETLINPQVPIPDMVTHITGITETTVKNAPIFEDIKKKLLQFIDNYPIVGHNINFDLTFLKAKGLPLINKEFDTLILSGLFLPGLPSYSLDTISRELKLTHLQKHRAMSDSHVCFDLFNIIKNKIALIPTPILQKIQTLLPKTKWPLTELFQITNNTIKKLPSAQNPLPQLISKSSSSINSDFTIKNIKDLENLFTPETILKQIIPNFEVRPTQQKLTNKILDAYQNNFHLLAEAGTGTGKSFSYLLAAAYFSTFHKTKVIISTYTNTLQDQLLHKDIPIIKNLFPKLKTTVLKGKNKYLSQNRFNQLMEKDFLEDHEISTIIKILLWLPKTSTGDLDELNLQNKELNVLENIYVQNDEKSLPKNQISEVNFYQKARLQAKQADIVIVNHSLLLQHFKTGQTLLPEFNYLIIDEAHHLEKVTTATLTIDLTTNRFKRIFDNLIILCSGLNEPNLFNLTTNLQILKTIGTEAENCSLLNQELFISIRNILEKYNKNPNPFYKYISLNKNIANTPEFHDIKLKIQNLYEHTKQLITDINTNYHDINHHFDQNKKNDINSILDQLNNAFDDLHILNSLDFQEKIIWISKTFDENIHFNCVNLDISSFLQKKVFSNLKSVILTSATLTTDNNFNFIRQELGLGEHFNELIIPSHFSYPDQVKILIPEDMPEPKDEQYIKDCTNLIEKIITINQGRSLVLFTAKKDLSKTFHELAPKLKNIGINLLAQGITGGRGKILAHFRDEPKTSSILGLNSFWEGVDLIGENLNCLIIQKLPFDPPDNPLLSARSQKYSDTFNDFALPRAILRFKQGFGRLIRSSSDIGTVIILDSRLVTKNYGSVFLNSLPTSIQIIKCPKNELPKHI